MLLKITTLVASAVCGWACVFGWYLLARFSYSRFCHYFAALLPFVVVPISVAGMLHEGYSWHKVGWLVVSALSYLPAFVLFGGLPEGRERWDMPIINLTQVFLFGSLAHFCIKKPLPQFLFVLAGAVGSILLAYLIRRIFGLKRG